MQSEESKTVRVSSLEYDQHQSTDHNVKKTIMKMIKPILPETKIRCTPGKKNREATLSSNANTAH